jgi:hypothetical protein
MFYQAVSQLARNLKAIDNWLDRVERHAAAKHQDVGTFINACLAPDMKPFIYQVQSACDYVKAAAAWLSAQKPPKHEDNEQTIRDLRDRIQKTVAFVESVKEDQYANANAQKIVMSWAPVGKVLGGEAYLLQMAIPNAYFHMAMAYAVLRQEGLDIGKMDFLGPIDWVDP